MRSIIIKRQCSSGVKPTTHLHLVPRSKMCGAITVLPSTPSWRCAQLRKAQEQFYLYLTTASRLALSFTQTPIHWLPGCLSLGDKAARGVKLTTDLLLVPQL